MNAHAVLDASYYELTDQLALLIGLFPSCEVVVLNARQAARIIHRAIQSYDDVVIAATEILRLGAKSILIRCMHFNNDCYSQDYWTNGLEAFWIANKHSCDSEFILSSTITACLTLGYDIKDAVVIAAMRMSRARRIQGATTDTISSLLQAWPEEEIDMPYLTSRPLLCEPEKFNSLQSSWLGLYPVVDSVAWLKILLPIGVSIIQLRIKDKSGAALEQEIQQSVALAKHYRAKLFINDYWELAMHYQAYGVHLGQGDLDNADIEKIRQVGLRLGVSTHCYYEVARAHALRPSYLACGPIFATTSKIMSFAPQGIEQLKRWRRTLQYPLVAIGGIHSGNIADIIATNVNGIAMISAITQSHDPVATTRYFLEQCRCSQKN